MPNLLWDYQVKKDWIVIGTAIQIIQRGVNNNLSNNIIHLNDP